MDLSDSPAEDVVDAARRAGMLGRPEREPVVLGAGGGGTRGPPLLFSAIEAAATRPMAFDKSGFEA